MGHLLLLVYRCLYPLLRGVVTYAVAPFNNKVRQGVILRKTTPLPPLNPNENKILWFHCSSGEFEYAKPVIEKIKKETPDSVIIVTYFSPSYKDTIESTTEVDYTLPLPWDQPHSLKTFLKKISPSHLIISKTDLWPELIEQVYKHKVPLYLIAGNFYGHNQLTHFFLRPLYRLLLSRFSHISCMSKEDQDLLHKISPQTPCSYDGDPRYEQVFTRLQTPNLLKTQLKDSLSKDKTIVFGSTWPQDDREVLKFISMLKSQDSDFSYILVPHELNEQKTQELCHKLTQQDLSVKIYSETNTLQQGEVLIVDQKGFLAQIYTWGLFAFVGGSFRKSVHSVMEPLAAGCITFVGPHHHNNREAIAFKKVSLQSAPLSPVYEIQSGSELAKKVQSINTNFKKQSKDISKEITQKVKENLGASEKILRHLLKERK